MAEHSPRVLASEEKAAHMYDSAVTKVVTCKTCAHVLLMGLHTLHVWQ